MINKIDLIDPYTSQYNVMHHFTKKLYEAWLRKGYEARYFIDADQALEEAIKDPPDLMIGFNGIPHKEQKYYCNIIKRPYLTILVDPFFHFFDLLTNPYVVVGCDDFSGYSTLKNLGFQNTLFIPHAVESDLISDPDRKRIYDVTMLATFIDYESLRRKWKSKYPDMICNLMDQIIEMTFVDPFLSFVDIALNKIQKIYEESVELKSMNIDTFAILKDIELYIKGKERVEMLKAIQKAEVHVFGSSLDSLNWKTYFEKQPNIIVHEAVSYEQNLEILKQSKIVLSSNIKNKFGAHERIFASLASGALILTNENAYLKKYFSHDIDIAFFQSTRLNEIDPMIQSYLSDEGRRQEIVENGREIVMNFHTWDARIRTLEKELFPLVEKIRAKDTETFNK